MAQGIFFIQSDGSLAELREESYDSESVLRELLAKSTDLLGRDQSELDPPRQWLVIKREMGVPDPVNTGGRWPLDHLFLDQEGIPTLVEVKRSTDTRIRREVVGQMLEYAANAVAYRPVERIQAKLESSTPRQG